MVTGGFFGRPIWLQLLLDGAAVIVAVAIFAQLYDPDVLFHVVWVVLALEAFAFGLGVSGVRIGLAVATLLAYSWVASTAPTGIPLELVELELSEWPLMLIIIVIVSVMADRVSSTGRRYAALYRQASSRLLTAQDDERKRLALDLHDGVGQVLTALTLTLDAAGAAPSTRDAEEREAALRRAQELVATALEETRGVAFRLRPARITETGIAAAIRELARVSGGPISVEAEPGLLRPGLLPPETEVEAYRIVQEAVGNALRHALAGHITIDLEHKRPYLRITITDDGLGFDPRTVGDQGLGLAGMHERALAIGALLDVETRPGQGTRVGLRIPMPTRHRAVAVATPEAEPAAR